MTVQECYVKFGGDYAAAAGLLRSDDRIKRFLRMVPEDTSFALLGSALESKNMAEAFRAAHTLKGICQNLSLTRLHQSASLLTDRLRNDQAYGEDIIPLYEAVKRDYNETIDCIRQLEAPGGGKSESE